MQPKTIPFSNSPGVLRAALSALCVVGTVTACGGGGSSGSNGNVAQTQYPYYLGVDCVASNGSDSGYVMGVCETKDGAGADIARTTFHDVFTSASSSKASPTISSTSTKSLSLLLKTDIDPLSTSLTFGANTDCRTYYSNFGALRGLTLTQFATNKNVLVDITSLASAVPGVDGPTRNQASGPCGNTSTEPSLDPNINLTGLDFGVYRYYAGAQFGTSHASYNGGWYARLSQTSQSPATDVAFNSDSSRLAAYLSTPTGMWTVSTIPTKAAWTASNRSLRLEAKGTWTYHTARSGAGPIPTPVFGTLIFTGSTGLDGKISGTIFSDTPGFGIDPGRFEGEFNDKGTEFAGRFVAKIAGVNARIAGAFAFKQ